MSEVPNDYTVLDVFEADPVTQAPTPITERVTVFEQDDGGAWTPHEGVIELRLTDSGGCEAGDLLVHAGAGEVAQARRPSTTTLAEQQVRAALTKRFADLGYAHPRDTATAILNRAERFAEAQRLGIVESPAQFDALRRACRRLTDRIE